MRYYMHCRACGTKFSSNIGVYKCPHCKGKLEIQYSILPKVSKPSDLRDDSKQGIWAFWRLLPVDNVSKAVSLGEGNTFLHRCDTLARQIGFRQLLIKDEGKNPTGSFKDRNAAVSVSKAVELGARSVAIASDGNAGPAVAAYAAKAKLPCFVFMPTITAPEKVAQAAVFGARVINIEGPGLVNDCIDVIEALKEDFGWHHLTTAGPVNPYQLEGPKTIAYEIAIELENQFPDWIAAPAGGGGLIVALFKAFMELDQLGLLKHMPRFLCVQASGCAPIVEAFRQGTSVRRWRDPQSSVAIPILVPLPLEGEEVLQALHISQGAAVSVTDEEILRAQRLLAEKEGVFASPAGVSAFAGAIKARRDGIIKKSDIVLVVVTETGLKELRQLSSLSQTAALPADPRLIREFLSRTGGGDN